MIEGMDAESLTTGNDLVMVSTGPASPATTTTIVLPAILLSAGDDAVTRFAEYFTVTIQNPHTRRAYFRNALTFLRWCEDRGLRDLRAIKPMMVAAFIEQLKATHAKPSVKQHLATVRMLFDWLVTGHVVDVNPAHSVRGPKHVVTKGLTPVLDADETKQLLDSIPTTRDIVVINAQGKKVPVPNLIGLRDRALIAAMFFTFARVGAVVAMTVEDYYPQGKRWWLRLHEKGGKSHDMPAHHTLEAYLDAYVKAAGIADDPKGPLFRSAPRTNAVLTRNPLNTADVWRMIRRRAKQAGIPTKIGCHSFRATGITNYLTNDGTLEKAQQMASHASPRTTKLYDRTNDQVSLDEVEKIRL
jgi:integrase/recombinase XerD